MTGVPGTENASRLGFNELLLTAVVVLSLVFAGLVLGLYALPRDIHEIPEAQPAVRVIRAADFPIGASRLVRWGSRPILVIRADTAEYFAVQGMAPSDGCILEWDEEASRILSPCSYVVYDVHGNVVTGLTGAPLLRYAVFVREGVVYAAAR